MCVFVVCLCLWSDTVTNVPRYQNDLLFALLSLYNLIQQITGIHYPTNPSPLPLRFRVKPSGHAVQQKAFPCLRAFPNTMQATSWKRLLRNHSFTTSLDVLSPRFSPARNHYFA